MMTYYSCVSGQSRDRCRQRYYVSLLVPRDLRARTPIPTAELAAFKRAVLKLAQLGANQSDRPCSEPGQWPNGQAGNSEAISTRSCVEEYFKASSKPILQAGNSRKSAGEAAAPALPSIPDKVLKS